MSGSALAGLAGRHVVLKVGGAAEIDLDAIALEVLALLEAAAHVTIVHGGGRELSAALEAAGLESNFIKGLRATDARTLDVAVSVFAGKVNTAIVAQLRAAGVNAVGLTGVDGRLVTVAAQLDPPGLGFVGEVLAIEAAVLETLTTADLVPVVAPIAAGDDAQLYNINADTLAGEVAAALGAARLVFISNVPGVLDDAGGTIPLVTPGSAAELKASGTVTGGMIPKIDSALRRLDRVDEVHIVDGGAPGAVIAQLSGEGDSGTCFARG
ncbi:MAG: acetylglutamate kinase [Chloroflexota bacterium]|jgi:acetylglutamate kinase|nr:acetylglutamate kinase [Chloroflexota bacterium]MDP6758261.1 acetylglutamate kinase [Chloroflexota bacterium]